MKKSVLILLAVFAIFAQGTNAFAQSQSANTNGGKRTMVVYFSASGTTEGVAKKMAAELGCDIYKIQPEQPYTSTDLNWNDKNSRTTIECNDKSSRPAIKGALPDLSGVDTIFVGFPVWWYDTPHIVLNFLESVNVSEKTIVPFCTSGGSGIGGCLPSIKQVVKGAKVLDGRRFRSSDSSKVIGDWAKRQ